jgi:GntR family transcriptional regulator
MPRDHVDPNEVVPKYYQLYQIIKQKIDDGVWLPHQTIPAERELEEMYNVSRTTVRKTLDLLVNRGILFRESGKGTFVSPPKPQYTVHELLSYSEGMRKRGLVPGHKVINFKYILPDEATRTIMELENEHTEVLFLERLRLVNDEAIGIHTSYVYLEDQPRITRERLEEMHSLYKIFEQDYNIIPTEACETIEAVAANDKEAELLDIEKGSPLLLIKRIVRSQQRKVIEYVEILYKANQYKYYVNLYRMKDAENIIQFQR